MSIANIKKYHTIGLRTGMKSGRSRRLLEDLPNTTSSWSNGMLSVVHSMYRYTVAHGQSHYVHVHMSPHQLDPPVKAVALVDADADNHCYTGQQHYCHCSHHVYPDLWAGPSLCGLHWYLHPHSLTPVARQLIHVKSTDLKLCVYVHVHVHCVRVTSVIM